MIIIYTGITDTNNNILISLSYIPSLKGLNYYQVIFTRSGCLQQDCPMLLSIEKSKWAIRLIQK